MTDVKITLIQGSIPYAKPSDTAFKINNSWETHLHPELMNQPNRGPGSVLGAPSPRAAWRKPWAALAEPPQQALL